MREYVFIGDISKYKKELLTTRKKQFFRLIEQCKRYESEYIPDVHPAKSTTYLGIAIVNLSLAYLLTDNKQYLSDAKKIINAVCNYSVWGNAHLVNVDLSASWIMFGLSLGYDWLREEFTPEEDKMIVDKLILQADIMYDFKLETAGFGWSTCYFQNHNWINMCGLAACGFALKDQYERAADYLKSSREDFDIVFDLMPEDGSNYEGVIYWHYGGMWLFIYAHLLKTSGDYDFFKTSKYLENTFYYSLYHSTGNPKYQLNFGDCHERFSGVTPSVYYKVAAEYKNGYAQTYANDLLNNHLYEIAYNSKLKPGILPEACFEFLWYDPSIEEQDLNELPNSRYFEDLGLVALRTGFNNDNVVFAYKCGYPGGKKQWIEGHRINKENNYQVLSLSHHHSDNHSFIMTKGDAFFAIDDGYNRNIMPDNHCSILVDNKLCKVNNVNDVYLASAVAEVKEDPSMDILDFYGEIKYFKEVGSYTIFKGESYKIYDRSLNLKEVSRTVIVKFDGGISTIVMLDKMVSDDDHTYSIIFNSDIFPNKVGDKFEYNILDQKMNYYVFSNNNIMSEEYQQVVKSVMTTQEPENYCQVLLKTLRHNTEMKNKTNEFYQVFDYSNSNVVFSESTLSINDDTIYLKPNNKFDFTGDYLIVSNNTEYILVNGSNLTVDGQVIISEVKNDTYKGML